MTFDIALAYKINDLMMLAKIEEICREAAVNFSAIRNEKELREFSGKKDRTMVILDLVASKDELQAVQQIVQRNSWKIFGFYPHVDRETAFLARALEISYVVPRSALQARLKSLLA